MTLTEIRIKRLEVCFCCLGYFTFAETIFLYNERPCCETCFYKLIGNDVIFNLDKDIKQKNKVIRR